jgi:hypothetical protein
MIRYRRLALGAASSFLALAAASAVYAQETTGAIRGQVLSGDGRPAANASVTIRHDPSGTTSRTVTNAEGQFESRGLRVGGPYIVTASGPGGEDTITVDSIGIGDPSEATLTLATQVAEVVVTGTRQVTARGLATRYRAEQIEEAAASTRDPKMIARLNPFVTLDLSNDDALIVAGANPRSNSLTVDGITQNDDFGINTSGYPTQRSPISLDALQALEVNVAPYSVEYNKFTGGNLNAVTKSGTNEFHGSLFYEYDGDDLASKKQTRLSFSNRNLTKTRTRADVAPFTDKVWGATLGGPILKDRLFFFGSYEKTESEKSILHGPDDTNRPITPGSLTSADVVRFENALANRYGFTFDKDNSILNASTIAEEDEKWIGKLDWNIASGHRLSYTYQLTDGNRLLFGDAPSATGGFFPLISDFYDKNEKLESHAVQIFSDWTDNLSTELTYSKKNVTTLSVPIAGCDTGPTGNGDEACEFAQVEIFQSGATVWAGPDRSRHGNELENQLVTWAGKAEYTLGQHTILAGLQREEYDARNLFAQQSEGRITFNSLADFEAGIINRIRYQMAFRDANGDGFVNENDANIFFDYQLNSFYLQDTFNVTDALTITYGGRYEEYGGSKRPNRNQNFFDRYGFWNDRTLDGMHSFLPRVSFNWRVNDRTRVSGGVGRFSGGGPNVWVANSFSNDGTVLATLDCTRGGTANSSCPSPATVAPFLANVPTNGLFDIPATIDALFLPGSNTFATLVAASSTNAISPNFDPATVIKASLSADHVFDFGKRDFAQGWRLGFDVLMTAVENGITWIDYRGGTGPCGYAPDGRPVYLGATICTDQGKTRVGGNNQDLVLTNTHEGHNNAFVIRADKVFDFGLTARASYTRTDAEDVNPGLSSVAFSNWSNNALWDLNGTRASRSNYEIRDSFKLDLNYAKKFFGDNYTRLTVSTEYRSGYPYSVTFGGNNLNNWGDNSSPTSAQGRQLIYVPLAGSDPLVRYNFTGSDAADQLAGLEEFINTTDLADYRGNIAPRNLLTSPSIARVDLHLSQELPAFVPNGAKIEAFVDVRNFLNILNKNWGLQEQVEFAYIASVVDATIENCARLATGVPACSAGQQYRYVYSNFRRPGFDTASDSGQQGARRSTWQVKVGARYKF